MLQAIRLRSATSAVLPSIDSIIAATAASRDAVLVHRDPHFVSLPEEWLKQLLLGEA